MPSINVTLEVTQQFLLDVLTTIVESPFTLWSWDGIEVVNIDRDSDLNVTKLTIRFDDPRNDAKRERTLDTGQVLLGIQRNLEGRMNLDPTIVGYIMSGAKDNDAGHIDAIAADAILQAAALGELVYG